MLFLATSETSMPLPIPGFPGSSAGKQSILQCQETLIRFLGQEDLLEKAQATHSSILELPLWFSW